MTYPPTTNVLDIELSTEMVGIAPRRITDRHLSGRVEVRQGDVQVLDLPDHSYDTIVSTYTVCTVPDPSAAAREALRVLRPNGRFCSSSSMARPLTLSTWNSERRNRSLCASARITSPATRSLPQGRRLTC